MAWLMPFARTLAGRMSCVVQGGRPLAVPVSTTARNPALLREVATEQDVQTSYVRPHHPPKLDLS